MRSRSVFAVLALAVVAAALWFLFGSRDSTTGPTAPLASTPLGPLVEEVAAPQKPKGPQGPAWVLRGHGSVVGVLKEYGTDRALPGVSVLLHAGVPGPGEELSTTTREDGSFLFPNVPNFHEWTLRARPEAPLGELELAGIEVAEFRATDLGVLYATPGFHVPGIVIDEVGDPVPGATVRAVRARAPAARMDFLRVIREIERPAPAVDRAETGLDGKFVLTKLPPGTYDIEIAKKGFSQSLEQGVVITPDAETRELRIVLVRGFTLRGRVVRKGGGSVVGLPVVAFEQPENDMAVFDLNKRLSVTDDAGEFTLEGLAAGTTSVVVKPEAEPFALQLDIEIPAQNWIEIVIEGDAWLEGRIVDASSKPVAGAQVYVLNFRKDPPMVGVSISDPEGRYRIQGLKAGPVELFMVQAEGFGTYPADFMTLLMGRGSELTLQKGANEKNVTLEVGGTVVGTVLDKETETPIAGVRVSLATPAALFGGARAATTDGAGKFEIQSVPLGAGLLVASKDGWLQPGVTPSSMMGMAMSAMGGAQPDSGEGAVVIIEKPGAVVERTVHLERGSTIRGVVLDPSGAPVRGARVALRFATSGRGFMAQLSGFFPLGEARLTNAEGGFELPGPAVGQSVVVTATAQGFLATESAKIDGSSEDPPPITVTLRAGASLAGRVISEDGKPLANAQVRYIRETEGDEWSRGWGLRNARPANTDAEGRYRILNVETGPLTVQVQHAQHLSASVSGVQAEDGKEIDLPWKLEKGLTLRGSVVGVEDRPVANAKVNVDFEGPVPEGGDIHWRPRDEITTDATGGFALDGLYPGTYTLKAEADGAAPSAEVQTAAGGPPVVLKLAAAFAITGNVRTMDGTALSNVRVRAYLKEGEGSRHIEAVNTNRDGRFEFANLPAGTYDIVAEGGWGLGSSRPNLKPKTVEGVAAGTRDMLVEVEQGLRIAGTVKEADGTPLQEGWIHAAPDPADGRPQAGSSVVEGKFDIPGLGEGKYLLQLSRSNHSPRTFRATAGESSLSFDLASGGGVRGRVIGPDGNGAAGKWVGAQGATVLVGGVRTSEEGFFEFEGLEPGTYRFVTAWEEDGVNLHGTSEEHEVRNGSTLSGVEIRVDRP